MIDRKNFLTVASKRVLLRNMSIAVADAKRRYDLLRDLEGTPYVGRMRDNVVQDSRRRYELLNAAYTQLCEDYKV